MVISLLLFVCFYFSFCLSLVSLLDSLGCWYDSWPPQHSICFACNDGRVHKTSASLALNRFGQTAYTIPRVQTFSAEFESWFRLHGVQQPFPHGFVVIKLGQLQQVHARTRCRKSVLVPCTVHAKWRVEFLQKRDKLSKPGFTKVSPCAVLRCVMLRCAVLCHVVLRRVVLWCAV